MTQPVTIWWRDDDATEDTAALDRLLQLKRRWRVPLSLAVIPEKAQTSLAYAVQEKDIDILVHGFAHVNHASPNERKAEFTLNRDIATMRNELAEGLAKLKRLLPQALPVFVPPWNRFPNALMDELPRTGYGGVSAWGPESEGAKQNGLTIANMHIDLIDWRNGAAAKPFQTLKTELETRVASGPIGILTHHLQMQDAAFDALDRLFSVIAERPHFVWSRARSIFRGRSDPE